MRNTRNMGRKRKTIILTLILVFIVTAVLTSCSRSPKAHVDLNEVYEKIKQSSVLPQMTMVDENMLEDAYAIQRSDCEQMVIEVCSNARRADEIVLIEAKDGKEDKIIQKLEKWLENRAQYAAGYSPEQYAIIKKCAVHANGRYISMIVSPEAQTLIDVYNSFF